MRQRQMLFCVDEKHVHEWQPKEDEAVQTSAMHERIMRYVTFVAVDVTLLLAVVPFIWVSFQHAIGNRIIIINHLEIVLCSLRSLCASKFPNDQFDFT